MTTPSDARGGAWALRAGVLALLLALIIGAGVALWPYAFDPFGATFAREHTLPKLISISVGWAWMLTGVIAWWQGRPRRLAVLFGLPGAALFITTMVTTGVPGLWSVASVLENAYGALIVHLLLAYPGGRLGWWMPRVLVAGWWVGVVAVRGFIGTMFLHPTDSGCAGCAVDLNVILLRRDPALLHDVIERVSNAAVLAVLVGVAVILAVRLWRASAAGRRILGPVLGPGMVWSVAFLAYAVTGIAEGSGPYGMPDGRYATITGLMVAAMAVIPLAYVIGVLRSRGRRTRVRRLLQDLSTIRRPDTSGSHLSPGKALWLGAIAAGAVFLTLVLSPRFGDALGPGTVHPARAIVILALVLAYVSVGLIESWRGYTDRAGPALIVLGAVFALSMLVVTRQPVLYTIGVAAFPWILPILAGLFLAYPDDALHSRFEWVLNLSAAAAATLIGVGLRLFWDPHLNGCLDCPPGLNLLLIRADNGMVRNVVIPAAALLTLSFGGIAVLQVRRWLRATASRRRLLAPMVAGAVLFTTAIIVFLFQLSLAESNFQPPHVGPANGTAFFSAAVLAVPFMWLIGHYLGRGRRERVGPLVAQLVEPTGDDRLERALRRALGDPTLRLGYAVNGAFQSAAGQWLPLPDPSSLDRVATLLGHPDDPVAVIEHDAALLADRDLLEAVAAAATLAAHNQRLAAEVAQRLEEVRASRTRIVAASDESRRRVERNIHDGAQQRLVALALELAMAEEALGDRAPDVREQLRRLSQDARLALSELRDLARGVYPQALVDGGLRGALDALAPHVQIATSFDISLDRRLPAELEAAAYFVVSEALTNAAKHAGATTVVVRVRDYGELLEVAVEDDGCGGADPNGPGLRGLADRIEAVDGTLLVASGPVGGTSVVATIPCDRASVELAPSDADMRHT